MIKKKRLKIKNIILLIVLTISLTALSLSALKLLKYLRDSKNVNKELEVINEVATPIEVEDTEDIVIIDSEEDKTTPEESVYQKFIKMSLIDVNFDELLLINDSTKGWISVGGTNINYPYVQYIDNEYYLTHSFNKSYNGAGWIFLDSRNTSDFTDKNTIIYGHSMLNKTMFGTLRNTLKSSWFNEVDNHVIKVSTPTSNSLWQVFSTYHLEPTSDYLQIDFTSDNQYLNFLNIIKDRSLYNFNASVSANDKILTLSSCYSDTERMVVHAKLIKIDYKN